MTTNTVTHTPDSAAEMTVMEAAITNTVRGVAQALSKAKTLDDLADAARRGAAELAAIAEQVTHA